jgi:PIN domain nuclease of toxin-antitoxin system
MLLDTNVIIWMLTAPERFGNTTRRLLEQTEKLNVSVATQYEIAIKERLGRFELLDKAEVEMSNQSIMQIPLGIGQLRQLADLKRLKHRDPFDLLIIALAIERKLTLVTSDRKILDMRLPGLQLIDARK